jgi:hypothetical protein
MIEGKWPNILYHVNLLRGNSKGTGEGCVVNSIKGSHCLRRLALKLAMVMGKAKLSKPLIFQSKLLCISLLYLITTLFLALYTSIYPTKCLFRSSPFDPIQTPFFSYPSSYGEHKYVIPTHRSSCSSPIYFSGTTSYLVLFCSSCIELCVLMVGDNVLINGL